MTHLDDTSASAGREEPDSNLQAIAVDHLRAVNALLQSAGRGELDMTQLETSLRDYWDDNGPIIRRAGTAAFELVRLQALAQLYQWRAQLAAQVSPRHRVRE
jgi:hypothetical protein